MELFGFTVLQNIIAEFLRYAEYFTRIFGVYFEVGLKRNRIYNEDHIGASVITLEMDNSSGKLHNSIAQHGLNTLQENSISFPNYPCNSETEKLYLNAF